MLALAYGASAPQPFWGPQTSAVNFCEEDYIVVRYIAEFINTVTSLAYIGYGYHGIRRHKRVDASAFAAVNLPYWGLITVGIFSGLYHSSLKYTTQMADEMSMHLAIGCVLIQLFTFAQPAPIQRRNAALIVGGLVSFVTYHCLTDEFAAHVALFFVMCVTVVWKTQKIIAEKVTDPREKGRLGTLAKSGAAIALTAYALWNIDVHCCDTLTRWKRSVGMPWGVLLELHGWWHVLTSVSSYLFMALIEFLTGDEGREGERGFAWPVRGMLGVVAAGKGRVEGKGEKVDRVDGVKGSANGLGNGSVHSAANGHANGDIRKRP